jgi:hypothetical protein
METRVTRESRAELTRVNPWRMSWWRASFLETVVVGEVEAAQWLMASLTSCSLPSSDRISNSNSMDFREERSAVGRAAPEEEEEEEEERAARRA